MITVAGVVFSITIAALAQAASQYTSRVLRNFMRDRGNQTVLGVFLGVFAYGMVVMHTIVPGDGEDFVPLVAVATALVLALVAVAFLVYFIHHVAALVQSGEVARGIAVDTLAAIDRMCTEPLEDDEHAPDTAGLAWHPVPTAPRVPALHRACKQRGAYGGQAVWAPPIKAALRVRGCARRPCGRPAHGTFAWPARSARSEERRVGKECASRWWSPHC